MARSAGNPNLSSQVQEIPTADVGTFEAEHNAGLLVAMYDVLTHSAEICGL